MTVAVPGDYTAFAGVGTEDVGVEDFGIARWKIDHNEGDFCNNQNDFRSHYLDVVLLGLVKQRVFFPKETEDEHADPLCKSNNYQDGYPGKDFPAASSGFPLDVVQESVSLPCAGCAFKEWGPRNAKGKQTPPPCKELYTFTFIVKNDELDGTPGIISIKGTSIGPAKKYIAPFIQRQMPLFARETRIELEPNLYMGRKYWVAKFTGLIETDPADFPEFASVTLSARDYLTKPPSVAIDALEDEEGNDWNTETGVATQVSEPVETPDPWAESPRTPSAPATAHRPRPGNAAPSAPVRTVTAPPAPPAATVRRPAPTRQVAPPSSPPAAPEAAITGEVVSEQPVVEAVVENYDDLPF